jgi:pyridoxal phosphate enzyme (YggS family)
MLRPEEIRQNLASIEMRIAAACARARRQREDVTLIAVSKTFPAEAVDAAVAGGVRHVGENRVQELRDKIAAVQSRPTWHLIGHLQSNKAKDAARLFDVIQTIDSLELAQKVSRAAAVEGKAMRVMIEVNIAAEPQKTGILSQGVAALAQSIAPLPGLDLIGLMTIPPIGTAEESRPWFRRLRELRDSLSAELPAKLRDLSMGMSEDFEVAIEEGATMIRVGRAIFGSRG